MPHEFEALNYQHNTRRPAARVAVALMVIAFVLHAFAVVSRGIAADRVPWANMYEFCSTGALVVSGVYLVTLIFKDLRFVGPMVSGLVLTMLCLATIAFPTPVSPLQPALQSYWLIIHVSIAVAASGVFTITFAMAVLQLMQSRRERLLASGQESRMGFLRAVPDSVTLENFAFRLNSVGFVFWTFTLAAGAIWADQAWGRFWGWDTKEVWTFVVWTVYAAYMHARVTRGWNGNRSAWLSIMRLHVRGLQLHRGQHAVPGSALLLRPVTRGAASAHTTTPPAPFRERARLRCCGGGLCRAVLGTSEPRRERGARGAGGRRARAVAGRQEKPRGAVHRPSRGRGSVVARRLTLGVFGVLATGSVGCARVLVGGLLTAGAPPAARVRARAAERVVRGVRPRGGVRPARVGGVQRLIYLRLGPRGLTGALELVLPLLQLARLLLLLAALLEIAQELGSSSGPRPRAASRAASSVRGRPKKSHSTAPTTGSRRMMSSHAPLGTARTRYLSDCAHSMSA